jgi:hypothetical protein
MAGNCASSCIGLPFELCLDSGGTAQTVEGCASETSQLSANNGGPREVGVGRLHSESLARMPSCQAVDFLPQLRAALPVTRPENDCSKEHQNSCNYFLHVNNHSAS